MKYHATNTNNPIDFPKITMNERIKQLAKQCYETGPIGKDGWPEYSKFNEQKFAELIVRECAQVCEDDITDGDACCTNTADRIARQIKKHFGVEE
jgi:hypothetical protein